MLKVYAQRVRFPPSPPPNYKKMKNVKHQLAADFTAEVFRTLRANPDYKLYEAIEEASRHPAPRFYIHSFDVALLYVGRLLRGKPLALKNPYKLAMYEELYRRYKEKHTGGRVNCDTLLQITQQPAPSYYYNIESIRVLFYKYQKKQL